MRKSLRLTIALALCAPAFAADTPLQPVLQWYRVIGGSGANQVAAAVADAKGNFYIAGSTSSIDFPITSAAQPTPGGSALVRITTATSAAQKLFPPGLSAPTSITADPQNAQIVYATQANAVWRSADGGNTWSSLPAVSPNVSVHSVAVDPMDPNTLYAATFSQGVFKSADGGQTWTSANNGIQPNSAGATNVSRVLTDPKFPQVVFAAAETGLVRSADAGASWTVVSAFYNGSSLTFDPLSPGTLYLTTYPPNYQPAGIAVSKSTDDGITFTPLSGLPDQSAPFALVADPFHAGVLYAGSGSGIYQSTDAGLTWTLKAAGYTGLLAADPNSPVIYANVSSNTIVRSSDGFNTFQPVGPPATSLQQIAVIGSSLFIVASPSTDVFVVKLDPNGAVVYSTYFGGSAGESAAAMALGADGSVYLTGSTSSRDFPVTPGAYASTSPSSASNFVFKLNPDGSLGWSTVFADPRSTVAAIAVDADGNPYVAGRTGGDLPTTPGAYQTQFQLQFFCGGIGPCIPGPSSAFVTKFKADGSNLIYSTYVPTDNHKATVQNAQSLLVDSSGNVYFGGSGNVVQLNADGSAVLASAPPQNVTINALARDRDGNVYATGFATYSGFPATPGAFQPTPQPLIPNLPSQPGAGGGSDAFVMKWDSGLSHLLAATLLGGEMVDMGSSIAVDSSGNVIVSGVSDSKAFPTRAPFQTTFSPRSGFVAGLDSSLSHLLFSTYLGDGRPFEAQAAIPDGSGNILLAGSTLTNGGAFFGGEPGLTFTQASLAVVNKIALPSAPQVKLDSVVNFASRLAGALAPGETIAAIGSGFGADAQLLIDGVPLPTISATATSVVAVMPDNAKTSGAFQIQVSAGGTISNTVLVPAAPAAPGLYSLDGSGFGQGYILNSDGTQNSPANPAATGSAITIFATGVGPLTFVGPYAVTAHPPNVFIDGFYSDGIAATFGPAPGLPGNVYQLSIYVPDPASRANNNPNLKDFKMPPQVAVQLIFSPLNQFNPFNSNFISQGGVVLNVKQ
ncbi:MAG TPA: hypothetical protein VEU96_30640 [Bryobacteraceae bacterium]|nr:hypothetical protein [Bryobacteraceae bacterium]